jgi:hypothetical protein
MTFAFNPHASQEANENFVRSLGQESEQESPPVEAAEPNLKPVLNLKPKRQRARVEDGKFAGDNPETPQNEAWKE